MRRLAAILFLASALFSAHALETASLAGDPEIQALLARKCIRADACGVLPIPFGEVVRRLEDDRLPFLLQQEYARALPPGHPPAGTVTAMGDGILLHIDSEGRRTRIGVLHRGRGDRASYDLVLGVQGERGFGPYDLVIHLRVLDAAGAGVVYLAEIHAYPHRGATRFMARRLNTVERQFRRSARTAAWLFGQLEPGWADAPYCLPAGIANEPWFR